MLFYHYTSEENLPDIMREGLTKGEAPISTTRWENAVNLTTDSRPDGHGLDGAGHVVTEKESANLRSQNIHVPAGTVYMNKKAVRIKLLLPLADRKLRSWLFWANRNAEPEFIDGLMRSSGGKKKAKTWWLYFGVIPPEKFIEVQHLAG